MGRFFCLLWQRTRALAKGSPLVFAVFMVVLSVTVFSYLFFYATIVASRANYVAGYDSMRRISVTLPSSGYDSHFVQKILDNGVAKPEQLLFRFSAGSGAKPKQLCGYYDPEKEKGGISGEAITGEDITRKALVVIPANNDKAIDPDPEHHETHKIGDTVRVDGVDFYAKGIRHSGWYDEIPYTTGLERFRLTGVDILVPAGLTDRDKQEIGGYCTGRLGATSVILPKPLAVKVFSSLFLPLLASVFIGIIAILNFIFLFCYMLEKCHRDYTVLRLCGCSRKRCLSLLFLQFALLFTAAYIAALGVLFVLKAAGIGAFRSAGLSVLGGAAVYGTFLAAVLLAMLPVGLRFFKKSLIDDEKLLS